LIDRDPRVLTRDLSDRVEDERVLSYAIDSRFYGLRGEGSSGPREVGSLRLSGGYDFEASETTNWFLEGHVAPHRNLRLSGLLGYNSKQGRADEGLVQLSWRSNERFRLRPAGSPERRHALNLSYRYLRDRNRLFEDWLVRDSGYDDFDEELERVDQLDGSARLALVRNLDLFARGHYSLESSKARGGSVGFLFLSDCGCWDLSVAVEQRQRPSDTRLEFSLRLSGLGGRR
jgi:lipopolysaccharide assembly outer membrane protein LptD (OstA)